LKPTFGKCSIAIYYEVAVKPVLLQGPCILYLALRSNVIHSTR